MVVLFILGMIGASMLLVRSARKASRASKSPRKLGRPDGVRTVYKRGH
jgi:F0F1-type ATP synthase assembly protein I